jgi:hypothetical protein
MASGLVPNTDITLIVIWSPAPLLLIASIITKKTEKQNGCSNKKKKRPLKGRFFSIQLK